MSTRNDLIAACATIRLLRAERAELKRQLQAVRIERNLYRQENQRLRRAMGAAPVPARRGACR